MTFTTQTITTTTNTAHNPKPMWAHPIPPNPETPIMPTDPLQVAVFLASVPNLPSWAVSHEHPATGIARQFYEHPATGIARQFYRNHFTIRFGTYTYAQVRIDGWLATHERDGDGNYDLGPCFFNPDDSDRNALEWCDECQIPVHPTWWSESMQMCDSCAEDHFECPGCQEVAPYGDSSVCHHCDTWVCENCAVYNEDNDQSCCPKHAEADLDGPMLDRFGYVDEPPWERRGVVIEMHVPDEADYREVWNFYPEHLDPATAAADFYLLEVVQRMVHAPFGVPAPTDLRVLSIEAGEIRAELIATYDEAFRSYVDLACGGEIRYHRAVGGRAIPGKERTRAWIGWKVVRDRLGAQALLDIADLFNDGMNSSVGGEAWATAALILHSRVTNRITPEQFCDRVFTLAHNGGAFLNKVSWGGWMGRDTELIRNYIGPAHHGDPPMWLVLMHFSSVAPLFKDYVRHVNQARRTALLPLLAPLGRPPSSFERHLLYNTAYARGTATYAMVKNWKNKELADA